MSAIVGRLRGIPSWQVTLGVALLALGFLIAAQLAAEGPRVRYTSQERTPLVEPALTLPATQSDLKDQIVKLRTAIGDNEADTAGSQAALKPLHDRPEPAPIAAGFLPPTQAGLARN